MSSQLSSLSVRLLSAFFHKDEGVSGAVALRSSFDPLSFISGLSSCDVSYPVWPAPSGILQETGRLESKFLHFRFKEDRNCYSRISSLYRFVLCLVGEGC